MIRTAALLLLALPASAQELTRENYATWRTHVVPAEEELRWRAIPWRATFWDAVIEAQETGKPILLWAMNGHPLACT